MRSYTGHLPQVGSNQKPPLPQTPPFGIKRSAANVLTNPVLDPDGKIPEFKFSACRVTAIDAVAAE